MGDEKKRRKEEKAAAAEEKRLAKRARREGRITARAAGGALARTLLTDPDVRDKALSLGLVRAEWVQDPDGERLTDASASGVLEKLLERRVAQHPSTLAALGLTAVQLLASGSDDDADGEGTSQQLTVVFGDLEGFTAYTAREGDLAAGRFLVEHQKAIASVVRTRGGRVVKHLGDGVLLTFPAPEAAVLASLELVEAHTEPLRLRVGMHVGEVLVTPQQDLVGHVVNVAARVTDQGEGGEVLTTGAVCEAATGLAEVRFEDRGPVALKGVDAPVPLFRVLR